MLLVALENRVRGGRGTPVSADMLLAIAKKYHDMPYCNTLAAYKAAYVSVVGPYRDVLYSKFKQKCGNDERAAKAILEFVELSPERPTAAGNMLTIVRRDAAPLTFKTSCAKKVQAYWDILRAVDPLLEAILDVGKEASTAEESITELNKVAAYDTAGHVAKAVASVSEALNAAVAVFGV